MQIKTVPLYELKRLKQYHQYLVEPYRYYASSMSTYSYYHPGSVGVVAYILCFRGRCIALHFVRNDNDNLIIDAESPEDIKYVIDNLLKSPELSEHEIEALARFFYVSKDDIESIMYINWIGNMINGKRAAIVRNITYILSDGIYALGEADYSTIRKLGGIIVDSPVSEMSSYIRRKINPDFFSLGRGGVLFCNSKQKTCLCFPVEEVIDILAKKMALKEEIAERWMKKGNSWLAWFKGEKYVSQCPPRRKYKGKEEREEALYLEYITR